MTNFLGKTNRNTQLLEENATFEKRDQLINARCVGGRIAAHVIESLWSISRVGQKKVSPTTIDDDDDDVDDSREA